MAFWRTDRNRKAEGLKAGEPGTQLCWLDALAGMRSNRGENILTMEGRTWAIQKIRGICHMSNASYAFNRSSQTEQTIIRSDKNAVTSFNHAAFTVAAYACIDHGYMNASRRGKPHGAA